VRRYCLPPFISLTLIFSSVVATRACPTRFRFPPDPPPFPLASAGKSFRIFHFPGVSLLPSTRRRHSSRQARAAVSVALVNPTANFLVPGYPPPCGPRLADINARVCADDVLFTMASHAVSFEAHFCPLRERTFGVIADSLVSGTLSALVCRNRDEGTAAQVFPRPRNDIAVLLQPPCDHLYLRYLTVDGALLSSWALT
jgi:hypothetical protein